MIDRDELKVPTMKEMFKENYGIDLTEEDYNNLSSVMSNYNVQPTEVGFQVTTSLKSYLNDLLIFKKINLKRTQFDLTLSDVIFELYPSIHPIDEDIQTNYPVHIHHKLSTANNKENSVSFTKNLALLRDLKINAKNIEKSVLNYYTFIIFNPELDVRAGIKFEKI